MKINVISDKPIETYYLENLQREKLFFDLDSDFDCQPGWYNLIVPWQGEEVDIKDIVINGEALGVVAYTGFFTEDDGGLRVCPGTTLYKPGYYSIWIHTNIGYMLQTIMDAICPNDWGSKLFDKYMLTVDRPLDVPQVFPEQIKGFFNTNCGPRWWRKNSVSTPFEFADPKIIEDIDRAELANELRRICKIWKPEKSRARTNLNDSKTESGRHVFKEASMLPFVDIDDIPSEMIRNLAKALGYVRILNINIQIQPPHESFVPHVDRHPEYESLQYVQGPSTFALNLAEKREGHYFKFSEAGLAPINEGVFFNFNYTHGTLNTSNELRSLIQIHGERDRELNYFMNV